MGKNITYMKTVCCMIKNWIILLIVLLNLLFMQSYHKLLEYNFIYPIYTTLSELNGLTQLKHGRFLDTINKAVSRSLDF